MRGNGRAERLPATATVLGEEFGEEWLLATIRARLALPLASILEAILTAALEFSRGEMADDLTLVVARGR